jgi:hypothetical protein
MGVRGAGISDLRVMVTQVCHWGIGRLFSKVGHHLPSLPCKSSILEGFPLCFDVGIVSSETLQFYVLCKGGITFSFS